MCARGASVNRFDLIIQTPLTETGESTTTAPRAARLGLLLALLVAHTSALIGRPAVRTPQVEAGRQGHDECMHASIYRHAKKSRA